MVGRAARAMTLGRTQSWARAPMPERSLKDSEKKVMRSICHMLDMAKRMRGLFIKDNDSL
jgi:hypothetical protein